MQKSLFRNMSILGLVLMAASTLTAAVVSVKKNKSGQGNNNGRLVLFSDSAGGANVLSCVPDAVFRSCTASSGIKTTTTTPPLNDSFVGDDLTDQTVGNTSNTSFVAGDQSSLVQ